MAPATIHLIRCAEGEHVTEDYHILDIEDPHLTEKGKAQALRLRIRFGRYLNQTTHILTSPMYRSMQTALFGFEEVVQGKRGRYQGYAPEDLPLITLHPDFQELGPLPTNTGSPDPARLINSPYIDGSLVEDVGLGGMGGWNDKWPEEGPYDDLDPVKLEGRERRARQFLWDLVQDAEAEGIDDVHIAVVTHANFINVLTRDWEELAIRGGYENTEFRSFRVVVDEDPPTKEDEEMEMEEGEVKEEKKFGHQWLDFMSKWWTYSDLSKVEMPAGTEVQGPRLVETEESRERRQIEKEWRAVAAAQRFLALTADWDNNKDKKD